MRRGGHVTTTPSSFAQYDSGGCLCGDLHGGSRRAAKISVPSASPASSICDIAIREG